MTQVDRGHRVLRGQVRKGRESLGLSLISAAKLIGVPVEELSGWESGESAPDDEELWNLAQAYGRPITYFFTETPETPRHQDFRSAPPVASTPSGADARRVVVGVFEELCHAQSALEAALERRSTPRLERIRGEASRISQPERLAEHLRRVLNLGDGPIPNLRDLLNEWGVKVFAVSVTGDGPSGTCWWHPEYGPAILVNRVESEGRRTFTLAHELAHLLRMQEQPFCDYFNLDIDEERFANRFAASLLMPKEDIGRFVQPLVDTEELGGWGTSHEVLDKIARHYKASREAAAWRLEELGLLPPGFTNQRRQEWLSPPPRGAKGKRWRRRVRDLGRTYTSLVREAYGGGMLSLSAAAQLLQVDLEQAEEWLQDSGSE